MHEHWTAEVLAVIATFESDPTCSIEVVQAKLQSVLTLWEGSSAGSEYDAIDLAENSLENVLFTRLLAEQRAAALQSLATLKAELLAGRR